MHMEVKQQKRLVPFGAKISKYITIRLSWIGHSSWSHIISAYLYIHKRWSWTLGITL